MRKHALGYALWVVGLCLCVLAVPIAVHHWVFQERFNLDLGAALGLLGINFAFFVGFSRLDSALAQLLGASFGLFLLAGKLFVNTFTIFLFIGLQAVRTHVFVAEFLAGYTVLLMGGVIFLHWNSKRF